VEAGAATRSTTAVQLNGLVPEHASEEATGNVMIFTAADQQNSSMIFTSSEQQRQEAEASCQRALDHASVITPKQISNKQLFVAELRCAKAMGMVMDVQTRKTLRNEILNMSDEMFSAHCEGYAQYLL
jgi:hypothetical protein